MRKRERKSKHGHQEQTITSRSFLGLRKQAFASDHSSFLRPFPWEISRPFPLSLSLSLSFSLVMSSLLHSPIIPFLLILVLTPKLSSGSVQCYVCNEMLGSRQVSMYSGTRPGGSLLTPLKEIKQRGCCWPGVRNMPKTGFKIISICGFCIIKRLLLYVYVYSVLQPCSTHSPPFFIQGHAHASERVLPQTVNSNAHELIFVLAAFEVGAYLLLTRSNPRNREP